MLCQKLPLRQHMPSQINPAIDPSYTQQLNFGIPPYNRRSRVLHRDLAIISTSVQALSTGIKLSAFAAIAGGHVRSTIDLFRSRTQALTYTKVTGDTFQFISWQHFPPVKYTRRMYWQAGSGSIAITSEGKVTDKKPTTEDNTFGEELAANSGVYVMETSFKLLRAD